MKEDQRSNQAWHHDDCGEGRLGVGPNGERDLLRLLSSSLYRPWWACLTVRAASLVYGDGLR